MIILRVTNEKGQVYDLQPIEDIDLRLDISAIENTEIGVQFGISSQEFAIAGDNAANLRSISSIGCKSNPCPLSLVTLNKIIDVDLAG